MPSRTGPRSVKDATRFTSTVLHATSKTAGAAMPTPQSRIPDETPEQRVRRLRLAHLAAQKSQVSRTDRIIGGTRMLLDVAHQWTIRGIVLFTAVAGVVSIYSVWDMLQYNRARRAEWIQAQKKFEADALSAARVAYLKGEATDEQIALVEEANREAEEKGAKLPPLLSPPEHRTHFEERIKPAFQGANKGEATGKGVLGILSGLWGENETETETGAGAGQVPASDQKSQPPTTDGDVIQSIETTVKQAWEAERENQRKGGSLDKLGLDPQSSSETSSVKKRWWSW